MKRSVKHSVGAGLAFVAALAMLAFLFAGTGNAASTRTVIILLVLTGLCTAVFVVELVLAASVAKPAPKLTTAQMPTPAALRTEKAAADQR